MASERAAADKRVKCARARNERTRRASCEKILQRARLCAWLSACALFIFCAGCGAGTRQGGAPTPQKSDFERKLDIVRRSPHVKIYVVRRQDSAPLSPDDKDYLRRNTPLEVATWVLTDDGTTAIAGANFDFEPKHFEALSKRFTVEDYTNK